ncbi:TPA: DNA (cytosine-5-)-methyltransferase [Escherichia coli]|jgi:DNA (cytosine-5)-methyltransferase 1|uniref:Type II methyltransferase M.SsoII n=22 Tax=Pseudomonadati TaxID=3379134 RepID=MTS2_SHISO|nr:MULTISPECIES: DNA (cytosine-5-)-methyltransferase [Enterobacteriaceae]P34879.1 RecName: Full=Type II methyltransferase M.SsoII; Short=M.SsoII; AltName: Full=Cytosine-specific methyltransferase SsoII; AltName: Full=Modification methylase SsoII [Shigella sonnei]AAA98279.1 C5-cytosine methylase [Plasmid P4]ECU4847084.1 DNA (cytosine-5-)-methyltransferase [Salmonella enterica]EGZ7351927.1 DNA (cytosine-5-)-methyltransferase [Salmonella enterica subsp. enterica serovar Derby]MDC9841857.1 DNA (cy
MTDNIAATIKEKRERLHMTQKEFADALGLSKYGDRTIRRWERGETKPTGAELKAVIDFPDTPPYPNNENGRYRMIDLFAGIGGTRLGFHQTNAVNVVFSSEWDKFAQKTYHANYGDFPDGDITKIDEKDIPDHEILVGGFPCVAFSQAGLKKGFNDTRGTLFFDIARIIKEKKPHAFLLENVKNLLGHDKGRTFSIIKNTLEELNYTVYYNIFAAKDFGVPQNRERIYIVGFNKEKVRNHEHFTFPTPLKTKTRVGDILEKSVDNKYTLSDALWNGHQRRKLVNAAAGKGFGYGLFNENSPYTNTISARYYKDGSEILIEQKGSNPRKITPREASRLQGFPSDFIIPVSDTQAYKQFGNSVAVPVINAIAEKIISTLDS